MVGKLAMQAHYHFWPAQKSVNPSPTWTEFLYMKDGQRFGSLVPPHQQEKRGPSNLFSAGEIRCV
jgi:hypothetical protein